MKVFGADLHVDVFAGAAFERHAVDGADEGDRDVVAVRGLLAFGLRRIRTVLVGDAGDAFVDFAVADVGDQLGQLDVLEVGELDRRHDFDARRV